MSDEEKKAIEHLKNTSFDPLEYVQDIQSVDIVLNLIEKQQKEIEEIKEDNKHQWDERCRLTFEIEKLEKENKQLRQCNKNLVAEIEYLEEK